MFISKKVLSLIFLLLVGNSFGLYYYLKSTFVCMSPLDQTIAIPYENNLHN